MPYHNQTIDPKVPEEYKLRQTLFLADRVLEKLNDQWFKKYDGNENISRCNTHSVR